MNDKQNSSEKSSSIKEEIFTFIRRNLSNIALFICSFLAVGVIVYFRTATAETVANFKLNDFEIGQISDRTIIADKNLAPDLENTVSVEAGEKVIKKGFPISAEAYAKLKKMAESPVYIDYRAFANSILYVVLIAVLWCFLYSCEISGRRTQFKESLTEVIFFLIVFSVIVFGKRSPLFADDYRILIIMPLPFVIFLVTILFGQLSAYFFVCILALGVLLATSFSLIPALFTICSSMSAAIIVRKIVRRVDIVLAAIMISFFNVVFVIMLKVIQKSKNPKKVVS